MSEELDTAAAGYSGAGSLGPAQLRWAEEYLAATGEDPFLVALGLAHRVLRDRLKGLADADRVGWRGPVWPDAVDGYAVRAEHPEDALDAEFVWFLLALAVFDCSWASNRREVVLDARAAVARLAHYDADRLVARGEFHSFDEPFVVGRAKRADANEWNRWRRMAVDALRASTR